MHPWQYRQDGTWMKFRMCFESCFFLWISNFTDICSYCRYYLLSFIMASLRIHTFLPCVTWKSCHACAYLVSQLSRPNTPITCWSFLAQKSNYKCHWINSLWKMAHVSCPCCGASLVMHLQKLDSQSACPPKAAPASLTGKSSPAGPADSSKVDAGFSVFQWINRVSQSSNEPEHSGPVTVGQGKLHYTIDELACPEWVSCGLPRNGYRNGLFQFVQKDRSDRHWVCWLCSKGDKRVDIQHYSREKASWGRFRLLG